MAYKFSEKQWQEWKTNPQNWWREHGVALSNDQQEWLQKNSGSANRWSYDEFKDQVERSQKFSGFFDWS